MQAYHQSFSAAQAAYPTPAAAAAAAAHYYHQHQQNHSVAANYAILQSQYLQQGAGNGDAAVAAMSGFPYATAGSMGGQAGGQVYGGSGLQVNISLSLFTCIILI